MAPFPYMPMVTVLASLVSYLVVQMSVFSYAGYMVEYLGVVDDKDKSGYYAGLLSSAFMIGRLFSSRFWGLASDRYGCRLVMVVGLVSTVVLSVAFGLSTTFTWAFIFRFLLGLLNGMRAASVTLVSEVCGKEHETVGMGVVTTAWSLGAVLGPGIGGLLSNPAEHHPLTFSKLGLFGRHPYLLPNVVGAVLALLSLPLVLVFLKDDQRAESIVQSAKVWLHSFDEDAPDNDDDAEHGGGGGKAEGDASAKTLASALLVRTAFGTIPPPPTATTTTSPPPPPTPTTTTITTPTTTTPPPPSPPTTRTPTATKPTSWRMQTERTTLLIDAQNGSSGQIVADKTLAACDGPGHDDVKPPSLLAQPHIRKLLVIEGLFSFTFTGFDDVFPLWSLSTVAKGGLDWSSLQIGKVFLVSGLMVVVFEVFAVPNLTPRLGVNLSQRVGSVFELPVYFLIPLLSRVNGPGFPVTFASLVLLFTCYVSSNSFCVGVALAINNATGSHRRGELNGLAATVDSFARAISPILCSALFAFSIDGHHPFPFDYHLVFYLLALLRLTVALMGWSTIGGTVGETRRFGTDSVSEASDSVTLNGKNLDWREATRPFEGANILL